MRNPILFRLMALLAVSAAVASAQQLAPSIGGYDWLLSITDTVNNLVTAKGGILLADGGFLLAAIGIIQLALLIIRHMKNSGGTGSELLGDAVMLLLGVCTIATILSFYMVPFPGTNISLHQLPGDIARQLTGAFDRAVLNNYLATINVASQNLQKPSGVLDFLNVLVYMQVLGVMAFLQLGMFCVTAIGFVLQGLLVLFGPILIPFALTKHFSHWAWGWLDNLVVYSMYRAVSAGVSFVWANVILAFFQNSVNGNYSLGTFLALLPVLWMLTLSFLICIFMIPSFTSKLFGGAGHAGQAFASDVRAAVIGFIAMA